MNCKPQQQPPNTWGEIMKVRRTHGKHKERAYYGGLGHSPQQGPGAESLVGA